MRFPSIAILAIASLGLSPAPAAETRQPNVIVLLADDQGWGDLGSNGNADARTPNLDSLARGGTTFDRFYVCPVCAPTRAEFLTGRYHPRSGVTGVDSGRERMSTDEKTIADVFKGAGYATGIFGKWHNGGQWPYHPNARGFDEFYGFTSGHWGYYFDAPLEHNGRSVRGRGYIADDLTNRALAFIAENKSRPFFCYIPFNTPHSPFDVPDAWWERWKEASVEKRAGDGANENLAITRVVHAMNENLDWNVGRVLRQLDEMKLSDDTIVVYFSDNGPNSARWNGGMKGRKSSTDEGGVRSPLFIRWPDRIRAGHTVAEIAGAIDLLPTLARLADVSLPNANPLDGRDLSPLLLGTARDWPDRMIFSHWAGRVSVRTPRHRLDDRGALFDLVTDPGQRHDISAHHSEETTRLRAAVATWRKEMFGSADASPPGANAAKDRAAGIVTVDARAIPVGYVQFPRTVLPAGEGMPHGGIRRSNRFPNCTYFLNWTNVHDAMTWEIDVHTAGDYTVEIEYACAPADVGSTIELTFKGATLPGKIPSAWNPPLLDREDRVPRQESLVKEFRPLALGTIRLEKGAGTLTLRARRVAGAQVAEIYTIALLLSPQRRP